MGVFAICTILTRPDNCNPHTCNSHDCNSPNCNPPSCNPCDCYPCARLQPAHCNSRTIATRAIATRTLATRTAATNEVQTSLLMCRGRQDLDGQGGGLVHGDAPPPGKKNRGRRRRRASRPATSCGIATRAIPEPRSRTATATWGRGRRCAPHTTPSPRWRGGAIAAGRRRSRSATSSRRSSACVCASRSSTAKPTPPTASATTSCGRATARPLYGWHKSSYICHILAPCGAFDRHAMSDRFASGPSANNFQSTCHVHYGCDICQNTFRQVACCPGQ